MIHSADPVRDGGNEQAVSGGIGNGDAADGFLIVADLRQSAEGIEVGFVSVFILDNVLFCAAAGIGQGQLQTVLVFVSTVRLLFKVVVCAVFIFPNVEVRILFPNIDPLVIIGAPAIAKTSPKGNIFAHRGQKCFWTVKDACPYILFRK